MPQVTRDQVERRIQEKQKKLGLYRANLDKAELPADGTGRPDGREWRFWLLIGTRFPALSNVQVPADASRWQFRSGFERVLLVPCDGKGVELKLLREQ